MIDWSKLLKDIKPRDLMIIIGMVCNVIGFTAAAIIFNIHEMLGGPWDTMTTEEILYVISIVIIITVDYFTILFGINWMYNQSGINLTWDGRTTKEEDE